IYGHTAGLDKKSIDVRVYDIKVIHGQGSVSLRPYLATSCVLLHQFSTLVCCFKATFAFSPSPEGEIPGITVTVDESRTKRSLADDPSFMASLTDLDRGLTVEAEGEFRQEADNFP